MACFRPSKTPGIDESVFLPNWQSAVLSPDQSTVRCNRTKKTIASSDKQSQPCSQNSLKLVFRNRLNWELDRHHLDPSCSVQVSSFQHLRVMALLAKELPFSEPQVPVVPMIFCCSWVGPQHLNVLFAGYGTSMNILYGWFVEIMLPMNIVGDV